MLKTTKINSQLIRKKIGEMKIEKRPATIKATASSETDNDTIPAKIIQNPTRIERTTPIQKMMRTKTGVMNALNCSKLTKDRCDVDLVVGSLLLAVV